MLMVDVVTGCTTDTKKTAVSASIEVDSMDAVRAMIALGGVEGLTCKSWLHLQQQNCRTLMSFTAEAAPRFESTTCTTTSPSATSR